ncbi:hypothetical protein XENTR_v10021330 [Xenopus tropicalis]|nr:hypothetical protein XENTR_v10021330 [Xenopus tropicalis]
MIFMILHFTPTVSFYDIIFSSFIFVSILTHLPFCFSVVTHTVLFFRGTDQLYKFKLCTSLGDCPLGPDFNHVGSSPM